MNYSTKRPMHKAFRDYEVNMAKKAIITLVEVEAKNHTEAKIVSDVVNMCRVFVTHNGGVWRGAEIKGRKITLADDEGVIRECIRFFGPIAWNGIQTGGNINISAEQGALLLDLADIYEEIISVLPESEVQKCKNIVGQYYKSLGPIRREIETGAK